MSDERNINDIGEDDDRRELINRVDGNGLSTAGDKKPTGGPPRIKKVKEFFCSNIGKLCIICAIVIILAVIFIPVGIIEISTQKFQAPTCRPLHTIPHGVITCSNGYNIHSICNVTCSDNHQIEGNDALTCLTTGNWSYPEPSCNCPECHVGDKCQYSTDWEAVDIALDSIIPFIPSVVNYGGHKMTCESKLYRVYKFHGECADEDIEEKSGCDNHRRGYSSASGAAKRAASSLIKRLVKEGKYPPPCGMMPTDC